MISVEKGMTPENAGRIVRWSNERDEEFLCQWAGRFWEYPLTVEQIMSVEPALYSICDDGRFAGMISVIRREGTNAHIGRLLIDPEMTGKGAGTAALKKFCRMLFEDKELETVSLIVFDYNVSARKCYDRCGFKVDKKLAGGDMAPATRMLVHRDDMKAFDSGSRR